LAFEGSGQLGQKLPIKKTAYTLDRLASPVGGVPGLCRGEGGLGGLVVIGKELAKERKRGCGGQNGHNNRQNKDKLKAGRNKKRCSG